MLQMFSGNKIKSHESVNSMNDSATESYTVAWKTRKIIIITITLQY